MNSSEIISALNLPPSAYVDQKVPKKLLLENGSHRAADKRYVTEGIEELFWVAALKPSTIGVAEYRDEMREYLEIAVLRLTLRRGAKSGRLIELVHRGVPYPVLLVTEHELHPSVSGAHKRRSHSEAGETVLEDSVISAVYDESVAPDQLSSFRNALAISRQPRTTLYALYQGWLDTVLALRAAHFTGAFTLAISAEHAAARRAAVQECVRLETEIARIRAAAGKGHQLSRQVELNLQLNRVQAAYAAVRNML